jgi:flagellar biogenesis protein FliO
LLLYGDEKKKTNWCKWQFFFVLFHYGVYVLTKKLSNTMFTDGTNTRYLNNYEQSILRDKNKVRFILKVINKVL